MTSEEIECKVIRGNRGRGGGKRRKKKERRRRIRSGNKRVKGILTFKVKMMSST